MVGHEASKLTGLKDVFIRVTVSFLIIQEHCNEVDTLKSRNSTEGSKRKEQRHKYFWQILIIAIPFQIA